MELHEWEALINTSVAKHVAPILAKFAAEKAAREMAQEDLDATIVGNAAKEVEGLRAGGDAIVTDHARAAGWNGACGILSRVLDGKVVSTDFPAWVEKHRAEMPLAFAHIGFDDKEAFRRHLDAVASGELVVGPREAG